MPVLGSGGRKSTEQDDTIQCYNGQVVNVVNIKCVTEK